VEGVAANGGMMIGPDMWFRMADIKDLKEQDVNAHTMPPRTFERLVANIKQRGSLESVVYCAQPAGQGEVEIVSGHHRARAARAAGIERIPVMVDTSPMTRSLIVAKQLAHNALVGLDDPDLQRQLTAMIDNPDDRLTSALPDEMFGESEEIDAMRLFTPRIDFDFRTVTFSFLPHQQDEFERLLDMLDGRQDLVLGSPLECFDEFMRALARYARIKKIRSGGAAITLLVRLATEEVERITREQEEAEEA
jgi:hypothetical protein